MLTIFVFAGFILTAVCYKQFSKSRILIALLSIISPTLAAISSIGYILIFGYHINVLILISPFLTLAIGIGKVIISHLLLNYLLIMLNFAAYLDFSYMHILNRSKYLLKFYYVFAMKKCARQAYYK